MRIVMFGAGRIGSVHSANLVADPRVSELLIADADSARAAALAEQLGATTVAPEDALSHAPDAVVIGAPTSTHSMLVHGCLDAGIPVFCEKPLAATYEETVEIVERVEREDARLQVGFNRRFDPPHVELRRVVSDGRLGTVYAIRIASHDHEPAPEEYIATSGGIFRDLLIHDFDALRFVSGQEAASVFAAGAVRGFQYVAKYGDVDTSALVIELEDGSLVSVSAGRENGRGEDNRIEIVGSLDCVALGVGPQMPVRSLEPDAQDPDVEPYRDSFVRYAHAYRAELEHFLSYASGEAPPVCTAHDGLAALVLAMAAERSVAERRVVMLSEIQQ